MSSSSEARWVLFGAVGLAAVVTWYLKQPTTEAATEASATESLDAGAEPLEIAVTEVEAPVDVVAPEPTPPTPEDVAPTPAPAAPSAPSAPTPPAPPVDVYSGTHRLGVNRVTDMARVGTVVFARQGGTLRLEGRVKRGAHWLRLGGTVEPRGNDKFVLNGFIEGVPDLSWRNDEPKEQRTEGSFLFEVNKRRPYWRLYQVNGRDCVCNDNCGNDFCYVDIETRPMR